MNDIHFFKTTYLFEITAVKFALPQKVTTKVACCHTSISLVISAHIFVVNYLFLNVKC